MHVVARNDITELTSTELRMSLWSSHVWVGRYSLKPSTSDWKCVSETNGRVMLRVGWGFNFQFAL